jgi:hypothetical protein
MGYNNNAAALAPTPLVGGIETALYKPDGAFLGGCHRVLLYPQSVGGMQDPCKLTLARRAPAR